MKKFTHALVLVFLTGMLSAQPELTFDVLEATFSQPVDIVSDGTDADELYIIEKGGRIYRHALGTDAKDLVLDLSGSVATQSEGGLLGMAFHPAYPDSNYFYVNYTAPGSGSGVSLITNISRFTVDDQGLVDPGSELSILTINQPAANHNAGDLAFGPDGYLYIPTGDGGGSGDPQDNAQDPLSLLGKMLRIDIDQREGNQNYIIPPSNPFANTDATLDEIWALGLRNPWRISFDRETGDLWIGDVGQGAREEVNREAAGSAGGLNYGWDCREGTIEYSGSSSNRCGSDTYTGPVLDYPRSGNNGINGVSITGGFVYRGPADALNGYYVFGDFGRRRVFLFRDDLPEAERLTVTTDIPMSSISTFGEGNDGRLYVADFGGTIFEISAEGTTSAPFTPDDVVSISIYPNPVTGGRLTVLVPEELSGNLSVSLFSTDGRQVLQLEGVRPMGGRLTVELPQLSSGVYEAVVSDGRMRGVARVILR